MFGQLAADEAFAFFYLLFDISATFFRITLRRFLFCEKYIIVFLFFPIFSVFLHNHIGCTLQSC